MDVGHLLDRIAQLLIGESQIRWCDSMRLEEENADGVSPGGYLNRFGIWVVATTIGGNAIVVREGDPAIYFADHTWYSEDIVSVEDSAGNGEWIDLPLIHENVVRSLFQLAESPEDFRARMESGDLDTTLDAID